LEWVLINLVFLDCMAQLLSLQQVRVPAGTVDYQQPAGAWAALRSLHELQLDDVFETNWLLPAQSPRCVCSADVADLRGSPNPSFQSNSDSPQCALGVAASPADCGATLQVEWLLPGTFDEWHAVATCPQSDALTNFQRRVWGKLHQLPSQLPRVRIVELEADDEPARDKEE
jgi:hypothetical protein